MGMLILKIISKLRYGFIRIVKPFSRNNYNKLFYSHLKKLGVNIIGTPKYIEDNVYIDPTDYSLLTTCDGVTISRNVTFLVHDYSISRVFMEHDDDVTGAGIFKPIMLSEGCFIGAESIILPGTVVGKNSIIGAGSIVKGNIPENVVAAGNPAKVIKTLNEYYEKVNEKDRESIKIWRRG